MRFRWRLPASGPLPELGRALVRTNLAFHRLPGVLRGDSLVAASRDREHAKEADKLIERFSRRPAGGPRTAGLAGALLYRRYGGSSGS